VGEEVAAARVGAARAGRRGGILFPEGFDEENIQTTSTINEDSVVKFLLSYLRKTAIATLT
jgi:hypothetical protein